jgi:ABC-type Co2+ transport system permease subunit
MHIPDGYLSPSTCAVLYAAAATGWYSALKRLKRMLLTRVVPLISVFAAFSFVVMMFNLPLPSRLRSSFRHCSLATAASVRWERTVSTWPSSARWWPMEVTA